MRINQSLRFAVICLAFMAARPAVPADVGPTYALTGCKIVSMAGPAVEKGVIVIRDGLIEALGLEGKIPLPDDAEVIPAAGMVAYPGLINAHASLFIELPREDLPAARPAVETAYEKPRRKLGATRSLRGFSSTAGKWT